MDVEVVRDLDSGAILHATGYTDKGFAIGYGMVDGRRYDFPESLAGHMTQYPGDWEPLPGLDDAPLYDPKKDKRPR